MAEGLIGGEGFAADASLIRADVNRQHAVHRREQLSDAVTSHAVREYLAVLDDAAFGGTTPIEPKQLAVSDPAARWIAATREQAFFAYSTNDLIDLDHAVIVDVETTTSVRQAEVTAQRRLIERTGERFGLWPERLAANGGYGAAPKLAWLVDEKSIEPHIAVLDRSARYDDTLERSVFTFDPENDSYTCPDGKQLRPRHRRFASPRSSANQDGFIQYRARQQDCTGCALRQRCPQTCQPARSCGRSTRLPATGHEISRSPTPISPLAASGRRSSCCSRTSSAF
jgi:hypothetical protein